MEYISGNRCIRLNHLEKAGDFVDGHTHNFDHTTFVRRGAIYIEATHPDGLVVKRVFTSQEFTGDMPTEYSNVVRGSYHALIKAEITHKIVAIVDDTFFDCVYSHRNYQGDVVQVAEGWGSNYV